jgi:hypothetical protein
MQWILCSLVLATVIPCVSVVTGLDGSRFIEHPIVLDDEERETEGKSFQTFASLKN